MIIVILNKKKMDEYDMYDGGDDWNDNDGYY
jgi:hypothetical protein